MNFTKIIFLITMSFVVMSFTNNPTFVPPNTRIDLGNRHAIVVGGDLYEDGRFNVRVHLQNKSHTKGFRVRASYQFYDANGNLLKTLHTDNMSVGHSLSSRSHNNYAYIHRENVGTSVVKNTAEIRMSYFSYGKVSGNVYIGTPRKKGEMEP